MKKYLLLVLPALMALSSCAGSAGTKQQLKDNFFKEDTVAHEEFFGGKVDFEAKTMAPFKRSASDFVEPVLAFQRSKSYEKVADSGEFFVAIRFIGLVASLDVNAAWTRSVYQADGTQYGTTASYSTTKAYDRLLVGEDEYEYPSDYADGYNYFVVYTLYDIPNTTFDNYYIVSYLTLSDPDGLLPSVSSKSMGATFDGSITAQFSRDTEGFFMAGQINGVKGVELVPNPSRKGSNRAVFESHLQVGDYFVFVNNDVENSKFEMWGTRTLLYSGNGTILSDFEPYNQKIETKNEGDYILYLNSDANAQLWRFKYGEGAGFYVRGSAAGGWDNPSDTYQFLKAPEEDEYVAYLLGVTLSKGDGDGEQFLIGNYSDYNDKWGYYGYRRNWFDGYSFPGGSNITGTASSNFVSGDSSYGDVGNIKCTVTGVYDIYLMDNGNVKIDTHVAA